MANGRTFGHIQGVPPGSMFSSRLELSRAGVHRPTVAGISGSGKKGSDSIVLNGGYADDNDCGDLIIYTGEGGQDRRGRQVKDQQLTKGNLALKVSCDEGLPVRVIRGSKGAQLWSPSIGYSYDGLYQVVRCGPEIGIHQRRVWLYRLEKIEGSTISELDRNGPSARQSVTTDRLIRDPDLAQRIKAIHDFTCQVCGVRLETPGGPYAEAAHIKPLGRPDDGPDIEANMLCVCPNHHKLLDAGGIVVDDAWQVINLVDGNMLGQLILNKRHMLTKAFLKWHRQRWLGH